MLRLATLTALAVAFAVFAGEASAHRPDFGAGIYASPEAAYRIADPAVSIVVYRQVTCERPELWMELEAEAGFELFVQLLVPAIERLALYRPSLAIVGPGLPQSRIGIDIPPGLGAIVFDTGEVRPELFHEPFTDTDDWILLEQTVSLPSTGTYYVVAWDPGRTTGKLAVAVGTIEEFGLADIFRFPSWRRDARAFHELGRFAPEAPVMEQTCPR